MINIVKVEQFTGTAFDKLYPSHEITDNNLILRIPFFPYHDSDEDDRMLLEYYIPLKELKDALEKV